MLNSTLPTIPLTDLRTKQPELIASLKQSPTMLTLRGHGAGVLVHPRQWNYLVEVYQKALQAGLLDISENEITELAPELA